MQVEVAKVLVYTKTLRIFKTCLLNRPQIFSYPYSVCQYTKQAKTLVRTTKRNRGVQTAGRMRPLLRNLLEAKEFLKYNS